MTIIERAGKSVNSVADETVSAVSEIGVAVAEGVIVTAKGISGGIQSRDIGPITVIGAVAFGVIGIIEWPVLVAAGGAAVIVSKLRKRRNGAPDAVDAG